MSYPNQDAVGRRLHAETLKDLDALEEFTLRRLATLWKQAKRALKGEVLLCYQEHFGNRRWNVAEAKFSGMLAKLEYGIRRIVNEFQRRSLSLAASSLTATYERSILRHAWILDQITPDSWRPKIPAPKRLYEARVVSAEETAALWRERWTEWTEAYQSSLRHNLYLNVINEGSLDDVVGEIEATRAGTPAADLGDALERLYSNLSVGAMASGAMEVSEANEDVREIWQTRGDLRVCEDCDPNLGLEAEEADGDIPMHPNCRCYWRLVPASYAELLRSGDEHDVALAHDLDARGVVADGLAIRDPQTGEVTGKMTVDFSDWLEGKGRSILAGTP